MAEEISNVEKVQSLSRVVQYRPGLAGGIVMFGIFAALLEGVGLSFIVPIVEIARSNGGAETDGIFQLFVSAYAALGIALSLETAIVGVSLVMALRYSSSFVVAWLKASLCTNYEQYLKTTAFKNALDAETSYFDAEGSDDILNTIITEARHAGIVIQYIVEAAQTLFLISMYLLLAFYLAPLLTAFTLVLLGSVTYLMRNVFESGYSVGDRVADANQQVQRTVQAGTQGIRDVKIFGLTSEVFSDFRDAIIQYTNANIQRIRSKAAISNFHDLITAISVFVLIYLALTYTALSFGALGLFLFAMFRLSPLVSRLHSKVYQIESYLSHLVRTQEFIEELEQRDESSGDEPAPERVEHVEFEDVYFSYDGGEDVLRGLSFEVSRGEFVGFVGQSGAGKSTIVSLLARMYDHDEGHIRVNGTPIERIDVAEWRARISIVRQNPFIFNDTLRNNVTIGNRSASEDAIEEVCKIANVTEFLDDLPDGYDTLLGDDGVRLSGGQRQRVAIARALLEHTDVLILDEATSDLDSSIEKQVQRSIEAMDRDYIIIGIAHRLSTVRNADRIYTVERGQIAEVGTHDELLDEDGTYAELYSIQSKAE